ncbi:PREDICTED: leukocyte antigen CD37 [Myotis davidii]|uniref:leukocyte antigen CD37 n=1 Tax=Myotis davidii TaxID=225400 RepID=UPI00076752FD|nr:PREDICTED: leukocyte antigen CD37 [Myotis davidii]
MSAQDSCLSLIKYLLFVFNLFFFVLGSLIFCFGIWILVDKTSFVSFVGLSFMPLQIWSKALAISGVLTMGLALLGCVGALKELRCLLGLYFGMLLLLFVTQITLGILISTQKIRLERKVKELVQETIQNYRSDPEKSAAEESWEYVLSQLRCCGWNSPQDWFRVPSLGGCARSLQKWLHNNLISVVGICLGVGLLEAPPAKLPMALGPWPLWDQDEKQPETGSAGAEAETGEPPE